MTVLCLTLHYLRLGLWTDSDVGVDPGWTLCVCVWSADGVTPQPLSGGHPSCVTQRIKDWLKKKSHLLWVPVPLCSQRKPWTGLRGPRGLQGIRSRSNLEGNAPRRDVLCILYIRLYCICPSILGGGWDWVSQSPALSAVPAENLPMGSAQNAVNNSVKSCHLFLHCRSGHGCGCKGGRNDYDQNLNKPASLFFW